MDSADFDALEAEARARMSPTAFAFCAAGADDEITTAENCARWRGLRLRPRVLRDVAAIDTATITYPTTMKDLEWLVRRSPIDVVVKGVLRGDDAVRCVNAGAKAVVVSNHGGRHLDTALATADALPEVVAALDAKAEVYVDGGIRRGTDILKALALGARAVLIGRPILWGLAVRGADGVCDVLDHLRRELVRTMALAGVASVAETSADLVARAPMQN